jgi:hypothetical protein
MPENKSNPEMTLQPATLRCTPPAITTAKETSVQSSRTTSKEMRKPTVLHMLQKYLSLEHVSSFGNGVQVPVTLEQRLWRPMETLRSSFWGSQQSTGAGNGSSGAVEDVLN